MFKEILTIHSKYIDRGNKRNEYRIESFTFMSLSTITDNRYYFMEHMKRIPVTYRRDTVLEVILTFLHVNAMVLLLRSLCSILQYKVIFHGIVNRLNDFLCN